MRPSNAELAAPLSPVRPYDDLYQLRRDVAVAFPLTDALCRALDDSKNCLRAMRVEGIDRSRQGDLPSIFL